MKRFLIFLCVLFSIAILYSQEVPDIAVVEEVELTEEEILCKQAAEDFMQIYEKWDVSKDYDILLPRIKGYVDRFYKSGTDPDESNRKDLRKLGELYAKILPEVTDSFIRSMIKLDIERIEIELNGQPKNPALTGYADKIDFDRLIVLENYLSSENNPNITPMVSEIRSIFRNIRRYSIGFDVVLNEVYKEVTRLTDKRVYFLYMESWVKEDLDNISSSLAEYVNVREEEFEKKISDNVAALYQARQEAKEAGDDQKAKMLYDQWLDARKVNIDKVKTDEVSRLSFIMARYMKSPGIYDVNEEFINLIKTDSPELESYFTNLLKVKFYHDLNSRMRVYSRFAVEKGFRKYRLNVLIGSLTFFILFFYVFLTVRKKRESIYIRRIPGLDAIDDAVGRATEMGKPIIYDSGLGAFTNVQTIASMLILRSVAKRVAEFKAEIIYPAYDPIVLQVAEEMIASGFLDAGYPEDHKKTNCFFMVQDQFAFAAGLSGLISRVKPASAFHFGTYAAESLLIAEAGFAAGAIQVAGTVDASQLPFFITACDYTLIGEELYAAAAYLSRDAQVLSNLKLSDYGKLIFGCMFLLGTILLTINSEWTWISDLLGTM